MKKTKKKSTAKLRNSGEFIPSNKICNVPYPFKIIRKLSIDNDVSAIVKNTENITVYPSGSTH